jgi:cell division protein FtsI/penicillin-binding protein 2
MLRQLKTGRKLATAFCFASLALVALFQTVHGGHRAEASPAALVSALPRPPEDRERLKHELDWSRIREDEDGYVQLLPGGRRVELTLDPGLQHRAERLLGETATPYAAAVVLSVDDGRVLALAGRSTAEPKKSAAALALEAWAPAASVFKLVTASALVEEGVPADARVCYHDGIHSVEASNLTPHPRWDSTCGDLSFAIAKSQNAIIARLAHDHLTPSLLERTARAFGFGAPLPFDLPVATSEVAVPAHDPLGFARTAAGFWNTTLSPLHGAVLAATIARGGVTPPVRLVDRIVERDGESMRPAASLERRVISPEAARAVARMMVGTTRFGTARLGFHDKQGRSLLPVDVAGKTGSLNRAQPFLSYSWFVGFAPADRPEVAFAVLLGNGENWHKKAHQVAADLLSGYFHGTTTLASR